MFYCNDCAAWTGWPKTVGGSHGRCEVCTRVTDCNEVPSKFLPAAKRAGSPPWHPEHPAFTIPEYGRLDKRFRITGPLDLFVDNDDVPPEANQLLALQLVKVLNENWIPPQGFYCENEDCERYLTPVVPERGPRCGACLSEMTLRDVTL